MSRDAITGYVESLIEDGEPVPVEDDLIECRVTVLWRLMSSIQRGLIKAIHGCLLRADQGFA